MNVWSSIQNVGTGFGLVAFIVAALLYAYRARLGQRAKIIKSAPPEERIAAIEATAELFRVDLAGLTSGQREKIVLKQIEIRARRELLFAGTALVIAILLATISVIAILQSGFKPPVLSQNVPEPQAPPTPQRNDDDVSAYDKVRHVRCETRDSIRTILIDWLASLESANPSSSIFQELVSQYKNDPGSIRTFHYNLFKAPDLAMIRKFAKFLYDAGIAYDFDFNPHFAATDTFGGLLTTPEEFCVGFIAASDDTGRIGMNKLVKDFINLSVFSKGGGPVVKNLTYTPDAGRTKYTVTVALAVSPAESDPQKGARVTGQGTPSEQLAQIAIDQFKGRTAK